MSRSCCAQKQWPCRVFLSGCEACSYHAAELSYFCSVHLFFNTSVFKRRFECRMGEDEVYGPVRLPLLLLASVRPPDG